jgi:hypothetical protein
VNFQCTRRCQECDLDLGDEKKHKRHYCRRCGLCMCAAHLSKVALSFNQTVSMDPIRMCKRCKRTLMEDARSIPGLVEDSQMDFLRSRISKMTHSGLKVDFLDVLSSGAFERIPVHKIWPVEYSQAVKDLDRERIIIGSKVLVGRSRTKLFCDHLEEQCRAQGIPASCASALVQFMVRISSRSSSGFAAYCCLQKLFLCPTTSSAIVNLRHGPSYPVRCNITTTGPSTAVVEIITTGLFGLFRPEDIMSMDASSMQVG